MTKYRTIFCGGSPAPAFQRQLGLKRYETACQILHKLRAAVVRLDRDRIGGDFSVAVDETWIEGRTRGESQHLEAYLNEFTFRFNRRFSPFNAFQSLLGIGAATEPTTYAALYNAGRQPKSFGENQIGS